ncbi:protein ALP1-like [Anneissia japonica]|uniref:protein ALP1-like n=1 Tax=Anneissia japonica TaxID=1529436 RepID=UPI0014255786|nr:protein ALP1-like [Anneissia japonica]
MLPSRLLPAFLPLLLQINSGNDHELNESTALLLCMLLEYILINLKTQERIRQQRRLRYLRYAEEQRELGQIMFVLHTSQDATTARRRLWRKKKSVHWWETIVPLYSDKDFIENFRLNKETFKYVVDELRPFIEKSENNNGPTFSTEWRVAMTLYRLSSGIPFNRTANQFGSAKSTACTIYHEVCEAIEAVLMPKFITFPTGQELKKNIEKFKMKGGFPQVVGAIDGTHIAIIAPRDQPQDYYNRKEYYSIVLQGVVDANGMFIDTFCGMPGSVNDARVFHISNFGEAIKDGKIFKPYIEETLNGTNIPPLILGDGAYPLLTNLMRPFPNRPNKPREQTRFNYKLSQCRVIVEHAFGRLKGRWRILLKRNEHETHKLRPVVQACCTLHNICTSNGVPYRNAWTDDEVRNSLSNQPTRVNRIVQGPRAEQVRNAIITELIKTE